MSVARLQRLRRGLDHQDRNLTTIASDRGPFDWQGFAAPHTNPPTDEPAPNRNPSLHSSIERFRNGPVIKRSGT